MEATESFKQTIKRKLDQLAKADAEFKKSYENPGKSLDKCITFILNEVKKSGKCGFDDSEVYGMAIHYYDEPDIDPGPEIKPQRIVINHHVDDNDQTDDDEPEEEEEEEEEQDEQEQQEDDEDDDFGSNDGNYEQQSLF